VREKIKKKGATTYLTGKIVVRVLGNRESRRTTISKENQISSKTSTFLRSRRRKARKNAGKK